MTLIGEPSGIFSADCSVPLIFSVCVILRRGPWLIIWMSFSDAIVMFSTSRFLRRASCTAQRADDATGAVYFEEVAEIVANGAAFPVAREVGRHRGRTERRRADGRSERKIRVPRPNLHTPFRAPHSHHNSLPLHHRLVKRREGLPLRYKARVSNQMHRRRHDGEVEDALADRARLKGEQREHLVAVDEGARERAG